MCLTLVQCSDVCLTDVWSTNLSIYTIINYLHIILSLCQGNARRHCIFAQQERSFHNKCILYTIITFSCSRIGATALDLLLSCTPCSSLYIASSASFLDSSLSDNRRTLRAFETAYGRINLF